MSETLKVGDKLTHFGGGTAFISAINKGLLKYEVTILGKNGQRTESYTTKEFNKYFEICSQSPNSTSAQVSESHTQQLLEQFNTIGNQQELNGSTSKCEFLQDVVELEQDLSWQSSSSEDSSLNNSLKLTPTVNQSLNSDIPKFQSTTTSEHLKESQDCTTFAASHPLANRSQSKEKGQAEPTIEIVSQASLQQSSPYSPITLPSKTCQESLIAHTNQSTEQEPITTIFCATFTPSGTMQNGKLLAADTLDAHSLEKGFCWLESPGALSSKNSRPPGLSRLESQLKKLNLLKSGECINPAFLENAFEIPPGWSDPSELRSAVELQGLGAKPLEIASIQEPQQLPSTELSTSNQSGSIYKYEKVIKGTRYPKDSGSWYYGYSYVMQVDGKWCDRSKSVSIKKLPFVLQMVAEKRNYLEILDFLG